MCSLKYIYVKNTIYCMKTAADNIYLLQNNTDYNNCTTTYKSKGLRHNKSIVLTLETVDIANQHTSIAQ